MAITTGAGPHQAWLNFNGTSLPILRGNVNHVATRQTSRFHCTIPLSYPGAWDALATVGSNRATVTVLTRGVTGTLLTGEIDDADLDLIGRKIVVTGSDASAPLHNNKTSEKWVNRQTTDIVQDLIGRVGLSGNITASSNLAGKMLQQDYVKLSDNVSFAYVIHKLSELDGARWWVDANGVFQYVPFNSPSAMYSISINQDAQPISSDCLALKIKRNIQAAKNIQVNLKAWHPKLKKVLQHTAVIPGNGGPVNYGYHIPTLQQDQVQQYARSLAMEKARHELTVKATVVGDPSVAAGMGLVLSGTDYFDQTYDIDTVHHDFGMSGHTTHITARSAKEGRTAS